jgi:hypothetical protein
MVIFNYTMPLTRWAKPSFGVRDTMFVYQDDAGAVTDRAIKECHAFSSVVENWPYTDSTAS